MAPNSIRRAVWQVADSFASNASTAAAIGVGAAAAYSTYRRAPARVTGHGRLLAAGTVGLATAVLVDDLAWEALAPVRRRFGTPDPTRHEERLLTPLHTLGDALAHITIDTTANAEHQAAAMAYHLDKSDGLLRDRRRWRGYPDGTASCYLAEGLVLHYAHRDGPYGPEPTYTLRTSEGDRPVTITSLQQLRLHLDARAVGLPVASGTDGPEKSTAHLDVA